jgi:uncharacterized protein (TIGR02145 family)
MLPAYHGVYAKQAVSSGELNNALNFDGVNDYVSVNSSTSLNITSNISLSAWVYRNSSGKYDCIIGKDNYAGNNGYSLWIYDDDKLTLRFGSNRIYKSSTSIPSGTWVHVAGTFDGTNAKLYINGTLDSSYPASAPTSNSGGLYLGTPQDAVGNSLFNFSGTLEDIRIWNIALTQSAIQSSMNNELLGNESGLVANYSFNQGIAGGDNTAISIVTDKTANAFNGTLTNFTKNGASSNFVNGKFLSSIISSGLVLHLDAGIASSYPGSGTTWTDLSGTNNHGTLENGPTYSSANGGSIVFDGVNDRISAFPTQISGTGSKTISLWIKINTSSRTGIAGTRSLAEWGWGFSVNRNGTGSLAFYDTRGSELYVAAGLGTNIWYHVSVTYDDSRIVTLYVNGLQVGISSTPFAALNASTFNGVIGNEDEYTNPFYHPFKGNIAQVTIYNRALTAAEVLENYNALRPRFSDVTNPSTGRIWMDRNLGATRVATSSTDHLGYGSLYQWGRGSDGHELITWSNSTTGARVNNGTTTTFSSTDQPGNANFILAPTPPYDWRNTPNNNLWQGVNGTNNPCPSGYRLPTQAEWETERLSWSSQNAAGAFASPLKLPMAGIFDTNSNANGSFRLQSTYGNYWSSTINFQSGSNNGCNCNISERLSFTTSSVDNSTDSGRSNAFSVRCIKD